MTSRFSRALGAAAALALSACSRDAVISAGKTVVDVEGWRQFQARRSASADVDRGLEDLSARLLLAEAGRRDGLDGQPEVRARLASARREILAQAFLDKSLALADREDLLRQRYQASKSALERRRIHPAHIAFQINEGQPGSRDAAQSKVARAYARLAGGEPFEKAAQAMSDDSLTGKRGGDLGPLLEGEVDAVFFAAAVALEKGEVSKPVESPFGFHLIKALEEPSTLTPSFEEAKGKLAAEARREAQAKLLERLKRDIGVTLHRERAVAAAPGVGKRGDGR